MKKVLDKANISNMCKGQIFLDCAIRYNDLAYILARADMSEEDASDIEDHKIPTRIIVLEESPSEDDLLIAANEIKKFAQPIIGISQKPVNQGLLAASDRDGSILPMGGGKEFWPFEILQKNGYPQCKRLRPIDGYTWAVGINRKVYKRVDIGKWENVTEGLDLSKKDALSYGFNDIDGFSEKEVYAVGGKGDIWKYDGKTWNQCGFPTNDNLYTVCCAKDGYVYVGARKALWKGKDNQWEQVCTFECQSEMNDLRWFADKLWLAYDYKLIMWDGQKLHNDIIHNGKKLPLSGAIDASDDMLLVACSYSAWTYDGKDWHNIIPDF